MRLLDPGEVYEDGFGRPLSSGTITIYQNETVTLKTTYADAEMTVPNANPRTLGADGRLPTGTYGTGLCTIRAADVNGATVWSESNIGPPNLADYAFGDRTAEDKLGDFFHVADYGAVGDGTTDDTAAIQEACAALSANGGGTLLFDPKTYAIYPTGRLSGSLTMAQFGGLKRGVTIDLRGATLDIGDTFAGTETLTLFAFNNCFLITVKNGIFDSTPDSSQTTRGQIPTSFTNGCYNIRFENIRQIGGLGGMYVTRDVASQSAATKCHNIVVENYYSEDVGYPLSFQNTGDRVVVRNTTMLRPGRAYFPYGVRNHDVDITVLDGATSPTCHLMTGVTSDSNYLENINLKVTNVDTVSNGNQPIVVGLYANVDQATPLAATIRNIHVQLLHKQITASALYSAFQLGKLINTVGNDSTDRGHVIDGVTVSGKITNASNRGNIIDLMYSSGEWGSGDTVRDLKVKDLTIEGSATTTINVDLDPLVDMLVIENVRAPSALVTEGTPAKGINYRNSTISSTFYRDQVVDSGAGVWTPVLAFGGDSTGITYSNQVGEYTRVGDLVWFRCAVTITSKGSATGNATVTLPFAASKTANFVLVATSGLTLASSHPYGNVVAAGTTISLADGGSALTDTQFSNSSVFQVSGVFTA